MSDETRPWWRLRKTDAEWCDDIRSEYGATGSDDDIRWDWADGMPYTDTWDHLGEAREAVHKLMEYLESLEAENERLRVALKRIVREAPAWVGRVAVRALILEVNDADDT